MATPPLSLQTFASDKIPVKKKGKLMHNKGFKCPSIDLRTNDPCVIGKIRAVKMYQPLKLLSKNLKR